MEKLWQGIDKVSYVTGYIAGWVLVGIITLTMAEVVTRYILRQPLILCDEFGGYSLFAITFLGLAYCAKEKGHIRITFLVERLPSRLASWLRFFTLSLALVYIGVGSKISWDFLINSFNRNIKSNSWLMVPLKWPQMVLPIGMTLFSLILVGEIAKTIKAIKAGVKVEETRGEEF
ncbi:MAG: TRAP transporter small permease [Deltaproteobacteria bacterium]|nr:TRAP transporter small permease [Deltaproteobacteria bacterium]